MSGSNTRDAETGQFKPGHTGMGGRPKGSRNKLTEQFWQDLHAAWGQGGAAAIMTVMAESPRDFVKIVASLMPKEFVVKDENEIDRLTDDELIATLAAVKSLIAQSAGGSSGKGSSEATGENEPAGLRTIN